MLEILCTAFTIWIVAALVIALCFGLLLALTSLLPERRHTLHDTLRRMVAPTVIFVLGDFPTAVGVTTNVMSGQHHLLAAGLILLSAAINIAALFQMIIHFIAHPSH